MCFELLELLKMNLLNFRGRYILIRLLTHFIMVKQMILPAAV
jgi:hypothetical protein